MPPVAPMLAKPVRGDPAGPALRAQVGRLPLDRLPRRRRGRDRQPQRAADDALLPRGRRGGPRAAARRAASSTARSSSPASGGLDFWALQQRIHPAASRVDMLAERDAGELRRLRPARARRRRPHRAAVPRAPRRARAALAGAAPPVHLTPITRDAALARDWFERFEGAGLDGVIAKRARQHLPPGQARDGQGQARAHGRLRRRRLPRAQDRPGRDRLAAARPPRRRRRPARSGATSVGAAPVGAVGAFPMARRRELLDELQPLVADFDEHPWDWAGASDARAAPQAGSRWNPGKDLSFVPLRPERVVEVRYDHMEGAALPPPGAVRPLAPGPRPRVVRLRPARAAGALRPRRRAARRGHPVAVCRVAVGGSGQLGQEALPIGHFFDPIEAVA